MIQAGISRREITPPRGLYLIGYGNRFLPNVGAREPLTVTALTLQHGATTVSIVACDLLAVTDTTYRLVQSQIPHPVLLCCSHTHSGPVPHAAANSPQRYTIFVRWMVEQIVRAVRDSAATVQPVTLRHGTGETHIAVNRRERQPDGSITIGVNPDGPIDCAVNVLHIKREDGRTIANLVNMACHPTVLDPGNVQASADWVGVMRAIVERETGAPVVFVQGACADLNPHLNHQPRNRWNIRFQVGQQAARDVLAALRSAQPTQTDKLTHRGGYIDVPLELSGDTRREVLKAFPLAAVKPLLDLLFPWENTITAAPAVKMRADAIHIGELSLVSMGAEVFTEIGMALKDDGVTIAAGVTNGCIGYLPTPGEHALGGYEVDIAPYFFRLPARLRKDAAQTVIEHARSLAAP